MAALAPFAVAGAARPAAASPPPTPATSAHEVEFGHLDRPAAGLTASTGVPAGVPTAGEAPKMRLMRSAAEVRSVRYRSQDIPPFALLGLTWAAEKPTELYAGEVSVAARTIDAAGRWSGWQAIGVDDAFDTAARERTGTEPLWTGNARGIEVVVSGSGARSPRDIRLALVNPARLASDHQVSQRPHLMDKATRPDVLSRATWKADETQMHWKPEYSDTLQATCLHHTETSNDYTADDVPAILRSIYHFHSITRGWGDIGYNALVDKFGRLWEGRYGGIDRPVIGAHAGGFNYRSGGISMLGSFVKDDVPQIMRDTAATWLGWKLGMYDRDAHGSISMTGGPNTMYRHEVTVVLPSVWPHRQTSNTDCPGDGGMRAIQNIRDLASRAIQGI
ncbi:N-acetylmuramoyl-L-alanine amidase [Fodinicola feengrottensis]|uniref:N-acetylmuramoyl-L-alanine amidase n=1 Tax=Fodinicola feengrottensis TaxID=435914 RepID=A0ABP4TTH6_9ACTN|nr:N-acetylmuramoyl-L-alanine amidase [Fodinicola feengrottensis]